MSALADNDKDVRLGPDTSARLDPDRLYDQMLSCWEQYAVRGVKQIENGLWFFGDAGSGENGIRSAANFVFTSAFRASRAKNEQSLTWAKLGIDYLTRGHLTGNGKCANGKQWGRAWQSSWWAAKLALGAHLIWKELASNQQTAVRTLIADEADHLCSRHPPTGLAWDTKAEENAWDTESLAAAMLIAPDHANAPVWREKLIDFALNSLSRAVDQQDASIVDGKPVRDRITSANVFHDFTIENHGSCHFCYVASPLDSLTWARAALLLAGQPVPEALAWNVRPFWATHKSLFLDNRFAYVGGQDWARYTYGQYFIVPVCVSLNRTIGDPDAATIELERIKRLAHEQALNGDGAFYSKRVTRGVYDGQSLKYETDCYAHLALARLLREIESPAAPGPVRSVRELHERNTIVHVGLETQVAWVRTPKLFASFCPLALESGKPIVLVSPTGADDLCEWMPGNLCGCVHYAGHGHVPRVLSMKRFGTLGVEIDTVMLHQKDNQHALEQKLFVKLDGDANKVTIRTTITALRSLWIKELVGLNFAIANDLFNLERHVYSTPRSDQTIRAFAGKRTKLDKAFKRLNLSPKFRQTIIPLNAEEVTIAGLLRVRTPGQKLWVRQSPEQSASDSLRYDLLGCGPYRTNFRAKPGEMLMQYEAEIGTV
ncbi:MAG: hypothetical protein QM770_04010 [Tepidisphaeraceae bacterium]